MTNLDHGDLIKEALAFTAPEEMPQEFSPDSTLGEMGISSITALEMAGYIEEKLSIVFPDDELSQVNTLRDFDQLIRRHTLATQE
ncbi:MAG TPA: acyl carrier protein [Pyrinomonadaceae bacterium]